MCHLSLQLHTNIVCKSGPASWTALWKLALPVTPVCSLTRTRRWHYTSDIFLSCLSHFKMYVLLYLQMLNMSPLPGSDSQNTVFLFCFPFVLAENLQEEQKRFKETKLWTSQDLDGRQHQLCLHISFSKITQGIVHIAHTCMHAVTHTLTKSHLQHRHRILLLLLLYCMLYRLQYKP